MNGPVVKSPPAPVTPAAPTAAIPTQPSDLSTRSHTAARTAIDALLRTGMPSATPALDRHCADRLPLTQAREMIRTRFDVDLGFDITEESFSAILGLVLLPTPSSVGERKLAQRLAETVRSAQWRWRWRFFLAQNGFPADTDCSGLACAALLERGMLTASEFHAAVAELLTAMAPTESSTEEEASPGVLLVYWEDNAEPQTLRRGYKHDPVACANALYAIMLACEFGARDLDPIIVANLGYLTEHLRSGTYRAGTRYYPAPEAFFFAAARLCARFPQHTSALQLPLRAALSEHAGRVEGAALLHRAQYLSATSMLGLSVNDADIVGLLDAQDADGRFPAYAYYRTGRLPVFFGSPEITTLFVINALCRVLERRGRHD